VEQDGFSDLWTLDLSTQAWTEVHSSGQLYGPRGVSNAAGGSIDKGALGIFVGTPPNRSRVRGSCGCSGQVMPVYSCSPLS
jgi:hypothetical protein